MEMGANAAGAEETVNSGPILGVRPADQRGSVEPQTRVQIQTMPEVQSQLPLGKAEIILALLAIFCWGWRHSSQENYTFDPRKKCLKIQMG